MIQTPPTDPTACRGYRKTERPSRVGVLLVAVVLAAIGAGTIGADVVQGGQLHTTNAIVGGAALALALAMAVPGTVRRAFVTLRPAKDVVVAVKQEVTTVLP